MGKFRKEHRMRRTVFTHEQLCKLVELEPTPQEEWAQVYRAWKEEQLNDLWLELKRIEEIHLRRLHNRRQQVENVLGMRLNVRVPRQVIATPPRVARLLENS
jgi:ribosomal protein S4